MPPNKDLTAARAALAHFETVVITAESVVSDAMKLAAHAVDVLKREAHTGVVAAGGPAALPKGWLHDLETATRALDRMVDAQMRLDKTAKDRAKAMSPEDRYRAMVRYVCAEMPAGTRARFIKELAEYHVSTRRAPGTTPGGKHLEAVTEDAAVPADAPPGPTD